MDECEGMVAAALEARDRMRLRLTQKLDDTRRDEQSLLHTLQELFPCPLCAGSGTCVHRMYENGVEFRSCAACAGEGFVRG
jgi:hypothetical protein